MYPDNLDMHWQPNSPQLHLFLVFQELPSVLDGLSPAVARRDLGRSVAAVGDVLQHLTTGIHGSDCSNEEYAVLTCIDTLARQSSCIMEDWGLTQRQRCGPGWLDLLQQVLLKAQIMFPTCTWPKYESAQDGLRQAITIFISNRQHRDDLLWDVNSMRQDSAAPGSRVPNQHSVSSQSHVQPYGMRHRKKFGV